MDLPKPWIILKSTYRLQTPWLSVREDQCKLPNDSILDSYYVVERKNIGGVIGFTKNKEVVCNYQYRHGVGQVMLEIPLGMIEKDEDPQAASAREFEEETGYVGTEYIALPAIRPNSGLQSETAYIFLAFDVVPEGEREDSPTEEIVNRLIPIAEFDRMVGAGELPSMWTIAAWHLAKAWLEKNKPGYL